jgi:hypothetical protein
VRPTTPRRAKDLPVFTVRVPKNSFLKSKLTSSGVASHLTTPSEEETDRLPDCATRRFAGLSTIGAWQSQSHPMFCGPSWVDHSRVPLCSSLALEGGPPSFSPGSSCPGLLRKGERSVADGYATITRCGAAFQAASPIRGGPPGTRQSSASSPTTPLPQRLAPCTGAVWAKPRTEQGQIGRRHRTARPKPPGRLLDPASDGWARGMIVSPERALVRRMARGGE